MSSSKPTPVPKAGANAENPFLAARSQMNLSQKELAEKLNTSLYALVRWERGDSEPNPEIFSRLARLLHPHPTKRPAPTSPQREVVFESNGARARHRPMPLFDNEPISMLVQPRDSLVRDITEGEFWTEGDMALAEILSRREIAATTIETPLNEEISAGKNTYTYDAHTYHTKVPPQGIARIISKYLPEGGLILDPFAGSGMTGVAARAAGCDVILNDLSPAACFIAQNFTRKIQVSHFNHVIDHILTTLNTIRRDLYFTRCRECNKPVEEQYTVWSYQLECSHCQRPFILWDHCRAYGKSVREHKLLRTFPCPHCRKEVTKSYLKRFEPVPVFLGYKCCSKRIIEHKLELADVEKLRAAKTYLQLFSEHIPTQPLPDGVNLNQPKRHGLDTVAKLYTDRNLVACAAIWREINRVEDPQLASAAAFVFTSLYQRVTRLSEYRFWGGSGNTANFNVPHIFNETNVFISFHRKAKSVADHFATTAASYSARAVVRTGSATRLTFLPNDSIDFIFTDPPFGSNINYSEMNILWESWLGVRTQAQEEAIVNRYQGKGIEEYEGLMLEALKESYRVLRPNHWMVLVFMNSSERIWQALRNAIQGAGFAIKQISIFDKQHATFKQFVSENTAGADLMIHCIKERVTTAQKKIGSRSDASVATFIEGQAGRIPILPFLHVRRAAEVDYRTLYSRYIAQAINAGLGVMGFAQFRSEASRVVRGVQ